MDKIDKQGMYKVYDRWPVLAQEAWESELEPVDFKEIDHIIFAGMGGSGTIGDFFSAILSKTEIHVNVVKGYVLPKTVNKNTLVVTTSVSGNTVETLTILESAMNLGCKLVAFSSGGKMEEFSRKHKIEYRNILQNNSPRASFASYLFSIIKVLNSIIPTRRDEVLESIHHLKEKSKNISSKNPHSNFAVKLAQWIIGIPIIYYPYGLQAAATRFKNSLQENAKCHAMVEDVIEACHNGIVAWEKPSNVQPILIQGADDYIKTKQRWNILQEYFEKKKISYMEIHTVGSSILSKLVSLIYLLDYTTIYRAILSNIDPTPITSVDFIKKRL